MRTLDVVPKCSKCDGEGDNACEGEAGRRLSAVYERAKGVEPPTRCFVEAGLQHVKTNRSLIGREPGPGLRMFSAKFFSL